MEEHDDWKLGDEGDDATCPRCGKRNRPGLNLCMICGTRLGNELETDPGSLRTIGETMGRNRPARVGSGRRSLRAWAIAVVGLVLVVATLTWLATREEPLWLEDLMPAAVPSPTPAPPVPTVVATRVVAPTVVRVAATPVEAIVPAPTMPRATARPAPRPTATVRAVAPKRRPPVVAPPVRVAPEPEPVPTPEDFRPRIEATERPSLGSDLQEASRAYRGAVDVHNQRVDEYNALADEVQARGAWDDSADSIALRRRLDRAREAVESARVQAELLRARMESVRARYR